MSRPSIRLGLIGAGRWGRNYIRTIAATPGAQFAAVASANPATAALVPAGTQVVSDWRRLLDPVLVDGVIVATPPALHAQMAGAALQAGLAVLIEKPLALDHAEALALRALAARRPSLVMVDHTHLFHPAFRALIAAAASMGRLRAIEAQAGNIGPFRADTPVLWDWGAHDVAMCIALCGAPPAECRVAKLERRMLAEGSGESLELHLSFAGAVRASVTIGNILPRQRRFAASFERGLLIYDDGASNRLVRIAGATDFADRGLHAEPVAFDYAPPLDIVVAEFVAAIRDGRADTRQLDLGVEVVAALAQCAARLPAT